MLQNTSCIIYFTQNHTFFFWGGGGGGGGRGEREVGGRRARLIGEVEKQIALFGVMPTKPNVAIRFTKYLNGQSLLGNFITLSKKFSRKFLLNKVKMKPFLFGFWTTTRKILFSKTRLLSFGAIACQIQAFVSFLIIIKQSISDFVEISKFKIRMQRPHPLL